MSNPLAPAVALAPLTSPRATSTPVSPASPVRSPGMQDRQRLWGHRVEPWVKLKQRSVGVLVGQFGFYSETPHAVALRWLEDCPANWQKVGLGWVL